MKTLKPLTLIVSKEDDLFAATWRKCRYVTWPAAPTMIVQAKGAGLAVNMGGVVSTGLHEYAFYDDAHKLVLREWIDVPESTDQDVKFSLPESVIKKLEGLMGTLD